MHSKTPSVTCMVLTFLTFSSLALAYPVPTSNKHNVSRAVSSRSPDPLTLSPQRMIPQAATPDDENSDLIDTLFDSIGLHDLTKLNHWKSDNEPDVIDDSNSPTKTVTSQNNDVNQEDDDETDNGKDTNKDTDKVADDSTSNDNKKDSDDGKSSKGGRLPNPAADPSGFVKALMENIQDAFKDAVDSSDEHTLH
ncbi:hypothetical protein An08g02170 [Aspergillus niger]|uniref:Uncharacterized protein n=3 Tax=Aspergillus TaxID=5052 RepID=A2QQD8_ASPNC|nr:hypothetical protein An08g02170 [Aspergillus niger]CAK45263.1 hypothetical protein An08g02170 [Aspergillus niger]